MKAPEACREPGIPTPTLPASHPRPQWPAQLGDTVTSTALLAFASLRVLCVWATPASRFVTLYVSLYQYMSVCSTFAAPRGGCRADASKSVPEGQPKIARRFSAGKGVGKQVPEGRQKGEF